MRDSPLTDSNNTAEENTYIVSAVFLIEEWQMNPKAYVKDISGIELSLRQSGAKYEPIKHTSLDE
jgi:hypothetical protein